MADGWIRVHRRLADHRKLWLREPFTRGQAWVDLLLLATWEDTGFWKRGVWVEQSRGQVAWSIKGLAARWKWSRGKVVRFLEWLKTEHQIEHQTNNVTTVITITNYERYQAGEQENGQQTDTKRTPNGHQTDTIEEDKEDKERKKKIKKKSAFQPPQSGDVTEYAAEIGYEIDVAKFMSHYEQKGWQIGRGTPMKCWKAAVRNWKANGWGPKAGNHQGEIEF